jgi:hypothetical protein
MKKTELVHLHMLLTHFMKYCEETGVNCEFTEYKELSISPFQIQRSMKEHKQAIFALAMAFLTATKPKPAAALNEVCIHTLPNFYVPKKS